MLRRVFITYEDPPTDFAQAIHGPLDRTDGAEAQDTMLSSHAFSPQQAGTNSGVKRTTMNQGGYNI